jgi:THO complex subunit 1
VQAVDLDLEMANTDEEKQSLEDAKMSKTWRALRLMSKTKLSLFDKVDDGRNLECFIQPKAEAMDNVETIAKDRDVVSDGQDEKAMDSKVETFDSIPIIATATGSMVE